MIYAAFTLWLFLILFAAIGVYGLCARIVPPRYLRWALLPGTIVSEMAYIFGCLITGGEVRRVKLLPTRGERKGDGGEPETETAGGLKVVSPLVASLLAIVACAAAILLFRRLLGQQIIDRFIVGIRLFGPGELPKQLPTSTDAFWSQLELQIKLLRGMGNTWWELDWLNWRVPLFVYLAGCFSIRIAPVNKPLRPTLGAAVVLAGLIALVGLISKSFGNLMSDVWPLLTYIWASLLFLLVAALLISGLIRLVRILVGKRN